MTPAASKRDIYVMRYRLIQEITCPTCGGSGFTLIVHLNGSVGKEPCVHRELRRILRQLLNTVPQD